MALNQQAQLAGVLNALYPHPMVIVALLILPFRATTRGVDLEMQDAEIALKDVAADVDILDASICVR